MTRSARAQSCARSEAGDTLIEVLVAVVILGLCVVGLMGGLTTSITSSSEHRSLASDDTVLRSFAEAAKYDIQLSPGYLYQDCATTYATNPATAYRVVNVYPSLGSVGTPVTVFGTDFTASRSVSVIFAAASGISSSTLTTALTKGQTGVTSLSVRALTKVAITSGEIVTIGSGPTMQTVTATSSAPIGATSIAVSSFTSAYVQPTGLCNRYGSRHGSRHGAGLVLRTPLGWFVFSVFSDELHGATGSANGGSGCGSIRYSRRDQ